MRITETSSRFNDLEKMSVGELLRNINQEDITVPVAVSKAIPQIEKLVSAIVEKMKAGGRLFYIGAGTSGRLGVLDASECPPSYGVPEDMVIGLIAGGDSALRKAIEFAEDDHQQAWKDLQQYSISAEDVVIGISASGTTPYVVGGVKAARSQGVVTGCITCNPDTPLAENVQFPVEVITGPEFVTGSTRMKAGTAQKLVLNMISTSVMIQLGRVKGNKMVDMQLSNEKLIERGIKIIVDELKIGQEVAARLLEEQGSVRKAIDWYKRHA
jgi:N-acetylmuramic acid 6-phosphate etherase